MYIHTYIYDMIIVYIYIYAQYINSAYSYTQRMYTQIHKFFQATFQTL